jgi:hypothetical protein
LIGAHGTGHAWVHSIQVQCPDREQENFTGHKIQITATIDRGIEAKISLILYKLQVHYDAKVRNSLEVQMGG